MFQTIFEFVLSFPAANAFEVISKGMTCGAIGV